MNQKNKQISNCCQAPIITAHGCDSDFGHNGGKCDCTMGTMWYECTECKLPCDVEQPESGQDEESKKYDFISAKGTGDDDVTYPDIFYDEPMEDKEEGWEDRFEKEVTHLLTANHWWVDKEKTKKFISQVREQARREVYQEVKDYAFNLVEACRPDCKQEEHAYHQATWNSYLKLEEWAKKKLDLSKKGGTE